jgi:hypothetical protein
MGASDVMESTVSEETVVQGAPETLTNGAKRGRLQVWTEFNRHPATAWKDHVPGFPAPANNVPLVAPLSAVANEVRRVWHGVVELVHVTTVPNYVDDWAAVMPATEGHVPWKLGFKPDAMPRFQSPDAWFKLLGVFARCQQLGRQQRGGALVERTPVIVECETAFKPVSSGMEAYNAADWEQCVDALRMLHGVPMLWNLPNIQEDTPAPGDLHADTLALCKVLLSCSDTNLVSAQEGWLTHTPADAALLVETLALAGIDRVYRKFYVTLDGRWNHRPGEFYSRLCYTPQQFVDHLLANLDGWGGPYAPPVIIYPDGMSMIPLAAMLGEALAKAGLL